MKARSAFVATFLLVLTACSTIGLAPAQNLEQRWAYAVGVHTAVQNATTDALEHGEIAVEDAQRVLAIADEARTALDAAQLALDVGDISTAESRIILATTILTRLQDYLRSRAGEQS